MGCSQRPAAPQQGRSPRAGARLRDASVGGMLRSRPFGPAACLSLLLSSPFPLYSSGARYSRHDGQRGRHQVSPTEGAARVQDQWGRQPLGEPRRSTTWLRLVPRLAPKDDVPFGRRRAMTRDMFLDACERVCEHLLVYAWGGGWPPGALFVCSCRCGVCTPMPASGCGVCSCACVACVRDTAVVRGLAPVRVVCGSCGEPSLPKA